MSRPSHLPPRCPLQKKSASHPIPGSHTQHHKSPSQGSIFEEQQPARLDELLSDQDTDSKGIFHRRSASDSITLLDELVDSFPGFNINNDEENSVMDGIWNSLESGSKYGPNSPRSRSNVTFSESAIPSVLSEYLFQNPLQYIDKSLCISALKGDVCGSGSEINADSKTVKRHSGQRSRVRKLQYIAELERTVNVLQTLESELAVKVASLCQKRVALSMENTELKQKVARLRQKKLILEGEYKSLKKEAERLINGFPNSPKSKARTYFGSRVTWGTLEMEKPNLNCHYP